MTDSQRLLSDLQAEVDALQDDLRRRTEAVREFDEALRAEYAAAVHAHRTADTFESWREEPITQAAVAWVLGTVFVRFLEDNGLVDARLSGSPERRRIALDQHEAYFQQRPLETDREYLNDVFREVGALPAAGELFDGRHNPLWRLTPSGDGAKRLLDFWQRIDPATGTVAHTFDDPAWDTRILGDLYQDLSESARKRYALLQTPRFVEAFILDRTLTPAIETFGYREATVIDPTCGSGHFLLGSFDRLLALHETNEPAVSAQARVKRVLEQIAGVDLNPFATSIARFRLLLAAMRACRIARLADAPAFDINVATGDSLLHGQRFSDTGRGMQLALDPDDPSHHHFAAEDGRVDRILGRQYHAVVGNPPYIVVRDRSLKNLYRERYASCHGQYSLVAPFIERMFELSYRGDEEHRAGYVGMIVANSFMKREFGRKLVGETLTRVDLTHVVDTAGAYIPGHGTPTCILFGRNRDVSATTRLAMGICGEPTTPEDPARGEVWGAILTQLDLPGSQSRFVSVADVPQMSLHAHPWSIGGGGAAELKKELDRAGTKRLGGLVTAIGRGMHTGSDDVYFAPTGVWKRRGMLPSDYIQLVEGEVIRDWVLQPSLESLFPYDAKLNPVLQSGSVLQRHLWRFRRDLSLRREPGGTHEEIGLTWFEWSRFQRERFQNPRSIAFAFVATHNHFVFDSGAKVFNRSAPIIKLPVDASDADHYWLLALLNSSAACFWLKQVSHNKGSTVDERGARQRTSPFEDFWELTSARLTEFPLVEARVADDAARISALANSLAAFPSSPGVVSDAKRAEVRETFGQLVSGQEELDWRVYRAYGLVSQNVISEGVAPPIALGERAFEIVIARRLAAGELETTWFERHGSTPITELPPHWPDDYKRLIERRIALIGSDRNIGLIEQPEYKRRWNVEPLDEQQTRALRNRLVDRLETAAYWTDVQLTTIARLADVARADAEFMTTAEAYRGRADFDVTALIAELVNSEAVPYLPILRYKQSGLRKKEQWERTWELQRQEDEIDVRVGLSADDPQRLTPDEAKTEKARLVGDIPVPPKYASADFRSGTYWRLRGKLDVPKERFITYPGAERSVDPTPVVAWAGWDHLQQAQALANYIVRAQDDEGWQADRLVPLLAGLLELVPWLKQWHNELDPQFQLRMGDYYADFVQQRARGLGVTMDDLRAWKPA